MLLTAADAVAVLHGAAVLFMLTGSLLALRWPRLLLLHAPVALAILAVYAAGQPCPLTTLELALLEAGGAETYTGGFLRHYVFGPLGIDVGTTGAQVGIHATAFTPNLVGYGLHALRARRPAGSPAT